MDWVLFLLISLIIAVALEAAFSITGKVRRFLGKRAKKLAQERQDEEQNAADRASLDPPDSPLGAAERRILGLMPDFPRLLDEEGRFETKPIDGFQVFIEKGDSYSPYQTGLKLHGTIVATAYNIGDSRDSRTRGKELGRTVLHYDALSKTPVRFERRIASDLQPIRNEAESRIGNLISAAIETFLEQCRSRPSPADKLLYGPDALTRGKRDLLPSLTVMDKPVCSAAEVGILSGFASELRRAPVVDDAELARCLERTAALCADMADALRDGATHTKDAWPVIDHLLPQTRALLLSYLAMSAARTLTAAERGTLAHVRATLLASPDRFAPHLEALRAEGLRELSLKAETLDWISRYEAATSA